MPSLRKVPTNNYKYEKFATKEEINTATLIQKANRDLSNVSNADFLQKLRDVGILNTLNAIDGGDAFNP